MTNWKGTVVSAQRNSRTLVNQPARVQQLRMMVADGVSLNEIKRSLGMGHATIRKYAPNAGWTKAGQAGQKSLRRLEKEVFG